jgi:signal transduction histidine kinase
VADELTETEAPGGPESDWRAQRCALSREIHDDVAHSILVVLGALERVELHQETWHPAARRLFSDARAATVSTLEMVRDLAARLRDYPDDHQGPVRYQAPADLRTELFCVLREAVLNALSHSRARRIVVDIERDSGRITAVVGDDGNGFEPGRPAARAGVGLASMYERTALAGGQLKIDTTRRQGTVVTVTMPCQDASNGDQ